ncbi:MAG: phosphoribosylanthranilate isomerase [Bacteroidales bacterium]
MIKIKVCGLTDPVNTKKISGTGIDFAGFIFYPGSKRFVGKEPDINLFRSVPKEIGKVGVFVNEEPEKVRDLSDTAGLDIVQLHGNENISYCMQIKSYGLQVIKAFRVWKEIDLKLVNTYSEVCDYYLFDSGSKSYGGSGIKFSWHILNGISLKRPFFLSGGIGLEDIQELKKIENRMFFAIDINSRFESVPGIKDAEKVKHFVEYIKNSGI